MLDNYLKTFLQCPNCKNHIIEKNQDLICRNITCSLHNGISDINGKLVLINDKETIIDIDKLLTTQAASPINRNLKRHSVKRIIKKFLWGNANVSIKKFDQIIQRISKITEPNILIVGGATKGDGMDLFYKKYSTRICSFDVFYSNEIDLIADGHQIPFMDSTFDLVIVQAVLEHVLEPNTVVNEIHRVLKNDGIVYAETPFMQQVHEGMFDYTRFTELGHINLFKQFKVIDSGCLNGLGTSLLWSLDYLIRGLFRSKIMGKIFKIAFFWIRLLDYIISAKNNIDGACGLFYLGQKSEKVLTPKEVLKYYKGAQ